MKTIKFSHFYLKMPQDFQRSKLLDVVPVKLQDLSLDFILYDTSYQEGGVEKQYPLPAKGDYMILLLQGGTGHLWTTIRSQWGKSGNKLEYYRNSIGEIIECKIVLPART